MQSERNTVFSARRSSYRFRRRCAVLLIAAVAVTGVPAGCSADDPAGGSSVATTPAARAGASAADPSPVHSYSKAAPAQATTWTRREAGIPDCKMADLRTEFYVWSDRATGDIRMASLLLVNVTDRFCQVGGWPTVTLVDSAQRDVAVPTTRVDEPGGPDPIELEPGVAAAGSTLTWEVCGRYEAGCSSGDSLRVGLSSGGVRYLTLSDYPELGKASITMAWLEIDALGYAAYGP